MGAIEKVNRSIENQFVSNSLAVYYQILLFFIFWSKTNDCNDSLCRGGFIETDITI